MDILKLVPLDKRHWGDFQRLLSGKEFNGCFCSRWTLPADAWQEQCRARPQDNLEHTRQRVVHGDWIGFLVVRERDGAVVGWAGSGPKTSFPKLKDYPASRLGPWEDSVWAIACLAVAFSFRGLGYTRQIVERILFQASQAGAKGVEAYPLEAGEEDSYRGSRKLYESLGFTVADSDKEGERQILRMEKNIVPPDPAG